MYMYDLYTGVNKLNEFSYLSSYLHVSIFTSLPLGGPH